MSGLSSKNEDQIINWLLKGDVSVQYQVHRDLLDSDKILDPTKEQFSTPVDYSSGKGKGFLTKKPSKRAATLIKRALL